MQLNEITNNDIIKDEAMNKCDMNYNLIFNYASMSGFALLTLCVNGVPEVLTPPPKQLNQFRLDEQQQQLFQ